MPRIHENAVLRDDSRDVRRADVAESLAGGEGHTRGGWERELDIGRSPTNGAIAFVDVLCQPPSALADVDLPSSAARSALSGRPLGDGGAGHPLGSR